MLPPGDDAMLRVSADVVALAVLHGRLSVLVSRRAEPPYRGRWALPGGGLLHDEDLEAAARRVLRSWIGPDPPVTRIEQLAAYGAPRRDPRQRTLSVAWLAVLPVAAEQLDPSSGWKPVERLLGGGRLAFDHGRLLADGVERARGKLEYSAIATAFLGPEFTIAALRGIYEVVWGHPLDAGNFHRKVTRTHGFVEPTGRRRQIGRGRPAELFRAGTEESLHPALTRRSLE